MHINGLRGDRGGDRIAGGPGSDWVFGDSGNDTIDVADGERDEVDCGEGDKDKVVFDSDLDVAAPGTPVNTGNCEIFESEGGGGTEQKADPSERAGE